MWLLRTSRAELRFFPTPESVDGGYAILSHTWGHGNEQSFQDVQALNETCSRSNRNPRDLVSDKIKQCCLLAQRDGYKWLWIDTCCIDKTSSTQLSEAINSMFHWYTCAEVCYAFLEDVPSDCDLRAKDSPFRKAKWHSRGWTLQELIAPAVLVFVSHDWTPLGNKLDLATLLQEITGVWWQVLTREVHFSVISVAQRMSWASRRYTTRIEDEAYCLMGLFNVNMPTIYGEGRQAFQRLQQEIMRQSFDTSLFAWGRWIFNENLTPVTRDEIYQYFNTSSQNHVYLLAHSPHSFYRPFNGSIVRFTPSASYPLQPYLPWQWKPQHNEPEDSDRRRLGPFGSLELPRFSYKSYGVKCRFPIIEVDGLTIAVLLCDTGRHHVGLIIHESNLMIRDPTRITYHCGHGFKMGATGGVRFARLISLGDDFYNMRVNGKTVTAVWRDIFIALSVPPLRQNVLAACLPLNRVRPKPPFRVPHWLIGRLTAMGLEPRPMKMPQGNNPSDGKPFLGLITFEDVDAHEGIRVTLGMCDRPEPQPELSSAGPPAGEGDTEEEKAAAAVPNWPPQRHWAKAWPQYHVNWGERADFSHDCAEHHLEDWPGWTKTFGDAERTIRLSFLRCRQNPEPTRVVHVELEGTVYDGIRERKQITFPTREELEGEDVDVTVGAVVNVDARARAADAATVDGEAALTTTTTTTALSTAGTTTTTTGLPPDVEASTFASSADTPEAAAPAPSPASNDIIDVAADTPSFDKAPAPALPPLDVDIASPPPSGLVPSDSAMLQVHESPVSTEPTVRLEEPTVHASTP